MAEMIDRDGLIAWFKDKPRDFEGLIAVRSALRAVPYIFRAYNVDYEYADRMTLEAFRSVAISWSCVAGYAREKAVVALAACDRPLSRHNMAGFASDVYVAAAYAAQFKSSGAVTYSASAVANVAIIRDGKAAGYNASAEAENAVWQYAKRECDELDRGILPEDLAKLPLFPFECGIANEYPLIWEAFRNVLRADDQGWDVWFAFFQERYEGSGPDRKFENALLSLSKEAWLQKPRTVNALLKDCSER